MHEQALNEHGVALCWGTLHRGCAHPCVPSKQCAPPQTLKGFGVLAQLSPECKALVEMANPPDSYEVYTTAISAAAISTQIKTIESKLGLQVCPTSPACTVGAPCTSSASQRKASCRALHPPVCCDVPWQCTCNYARLLCIAGVHVPMNQMHACTATCLFCAR